jgi:hypothetical protein
MKTVYLFARITDRGLSRERASECPTGRTGETPIATLTEQPDNYWELMRAKHGNAIELDKPLT